MRLVAKLLLECKKKNTEKKSIEEFVNPSDIDIVIDASLLLCGSTGPFSMTKPSVSFRLKEDLQHLGEIKEVISIREGDVSKQEEA